MSCTWRWAAAPKEGADPLGMDELVARVTAVLEASSVVITRTRKGEELTDDIRAGISTLQLLGPVGPQRLLIAPAVAKGIVLAWPVTGRFGLRRVPRTARFIVAALLGVFEFLFDLRSFFRVLLSFSFG